MPYVRDAFLCLDCDWISDKCECPKCLSRSSYPLRRWLKSMTTFSEIQEEKKHAKEQYEMDYKAQEESNRSIPTIVTTDSYYSDGPYAPRSVFKTVQSDKQNRPVQNYNDESFGLSVSESNHRSGIELDAERRFKQRRNWFDAGTSAIRKGIRRFLST